MGYFWTSRPIGDSKDVDRRNIRVVLELVLVMGLPWLTESVGFFLRWNDDPAWNSPFFIFSHSLNQLTGVLILILFLLRKKNRELLRDWVVSRPEDEMGMMQNLSHLTHRTVESS